MSDNIIKFPYQNRSNEKPVTNRQKVKVLGFGLAGVFVVALAFNLLTEVATQEQSAQRSLASVGDPETHLNWEHRLAEKLSQQRGRDLASVGKGAGTVESLQYGTFGGSYRFMFEDGQVKEISFSGAEEEASPKYIGNRERFLSRYNSLFNVDFETLRRSEEGAEMNPSVEEFQLLNNGQVVGEAEFQLDKYERVISLRVKNGTHK